MNISRGIDHLKEIGNAIIEFLTNWVAMTIIVALCAGFVYLVFTQPGSLIKDAAIFIASCLGFGIFAYALERIFPGIWD